jgi:hypothetical protein
MTASTSAVKKATDDSTNVFSPRFGSGFRFSCGLGISLGLSCGLTGGRGLMGSG